MAGIKHSDPYTSFMDNRTDPVGKEMHLPLRYVGVNIFLNST